MRISVEEAEDRLEELVQRAEAGEEVLLTIRGRIVVRIEPISIMSQAKPREFR